MKETLLSLALGTAAILLSWSLAGSLLRGVKSALWYFEHNLWGGALWAGLAVGIALTLVAFLFVALLLGEVLRAYFSGRPE